MATAIGAVTYRRYWRLTGEFIYGLVLGVIAWIFAKIATSNSAALAAFGEFKLAELLWAAGVVIVFVEVKLNNFNFKRLEANQMMILDSLWGTRFCQFGGLCLWPPSLFFPSKEGDHGDGIVTVKEDIVDLDWIILEARHGRVKVKFRVQGIPNDPVRAYTMLIWAKRGEAMSTRIFDIADTIVGSNEFSAVRYSQPLGGKELHQHVNDNADWKKWLADRGLKDYKVFQVDVAAADPKVEAALDAAQAALATFEADQEIMQHLGTFGVTGDRAYMVTRMAELLKSPGAGSALGLDMMLGPMIWPMWMQFAQQATTPRPATNPTTGGTTPPPAHAGGHI